MNVEYVSIDTLKTYVNNAKQHPAEQIEQIKESIKDYGFNDPIAVDENDVIIEGHGRLIAAKELGMKEVPVIRLSGMPEDKKRAYMLVHNKLTMNTGFDYDVLMSELEESDIDMDKYGFALPDMDQEYTIENREYSLDDFKDEKFKYECENCGFRFNA